jgi:hypothetical protein
MNRFLKKFGSFSKNIELNIGLVIFPILHAIVKYFGGYFFDGLIKKIISMLGVKEEGLFSFLISNAVSSLSVGIVIILIYCVFWWRHKRELKINESKEKIILLNSFELEGKTNGNSLGSGIIIVIVILFLISFFVPRKKPAAKPIIPAHEKNKVAIQKKEKEPNLSEIANDLLKSEVLEEFEVNRDTESLVRLTVIPAVPYPNYWLEVSGNLWRGYFPLRFKSPKCDATQRFILRKKIEFNEWTISSASNSRLALELLKGDCDYGRDNVSMHDINGNIGDLPSQRWVIKPSGRANEFLIQPGKMNDGICENLFLNLYGGDYRAEVPEFGLEKWNDDGPERWIIQRIRLDKSETPKLSKK